MPAKKVATVESESTGGRKRVGVSSTASKNAASPSTSQPVSSSQLGVSQQSSSSGGAALSKKALLNEQREAAEALRQEQRTYSALQSPAHAFTPWNRVVTDALQRRNYFFQFEVKHSAARGKKLVRELKRFVDDVEKREIQMLEQQERECTRIGAALGKAVAKRWSTIGNAFTRLQRVEYEFLKQRKAQKKQEELLKETEAMTSQLITWVLERKKAARERNSRAIEQPSAPTAATSEGKELPDLEKALSAGQDLFDETKSLALFNSLDGTRPLREYQRTALQWMINLYTNDLNGILADEMGLGKTVQTIALLCYFAQYKQDWGPHLVVVPTTVVLNWQTELMRWAPGFKVITYIGSREQRVELRKGWTKQGAFDVCITSYNVFMRDQDSFRRLYWGFLILDEAHQIKNFASQKWQSLYELKTSYRLLLTGTPLQNNVMELWSLFHFLMPSATAFASHEEFESWYSNPMNDMVSGKAQLNEELVRRLQALIRPFLLRRLKKDVETQLPSKTTRIIKCSLSPRQRTLYDEFLNLKNTKAAIRSGGYQGVLSVILSLRKVCNHPDLFEPRPIASPFVLPRHEPILLVVPGSVLLLENDDESLFDTKRSLQWRQGGGILLNRDGQRAIKPAAFRTPTVCGPSAAMLLGISPLFGRVGSAAHHGPVGLRSQFSNGGSGSACGVFPSSLLVHSAAGHRGGSWWRNFSCSDAQRRRLLEAVTSWTAPTMSGSPQAASTNVSATNRKQSVHVIGSTVALPAWACALFSPDYETKTHGVPMPLVAASTEWMDYTLVAADYLWRLPVELLLRHVQPFLVCNILSGMCGSTPHSVQGGLDKSIIAWSISRLARRRIFDPLMDSQTSKVGVDGELAQKRLFEPKSSLALACLVHDASITAHALAPTIAKIAFVVPRCLSQTSAMVAGGSLFGGTAPQLVANGRRVSHFKPFRQPLIEDVPRIVSAIGLAGGLGNTSTQIAKGRRLHAVSELAWVSHNRTLQLINGGSAKRKRTYASLPPHATAALAKLRQEAEDPSVLRFSLANRDDACTFYDATGSYIVASNTYSAAALPSPLWTLSTSRVLSFPDKSTLIHDSGKLQTLSTLLPKLRAEGHRCLIFSQFTIMLDILQKFLAMRGFPCLRIDGATGAVERQDYVERFNRDDRITCMILSTRSGGIGLNLVGADTVIFYDSDWNPTIDLQAQDRCHRIGQTRSVTIYRLICDKTIEEQILEKARERERLNSVVIRSGAFHITAWDHHEKASEELKKQMGDGADASAAAAAAMSSGATSALLTKQDLRGFFKNVTDDEVIVEDDTSGALNDEEDDEAAMERAMDVVEDDADRSARQAASREIHDSALAEQQDATLMESSAVGGEVVAALMDGGLEAGVPDDERDAGALHYRVGEGGTSLQAGAKRQQTTTERGNPTFAPPSLPPSSSYSFTRDELLTIRRQRQQLMMRLPNVVDRTIVSQFARAHPAKARATRKVLYEEYRDEIKGAAMEAEAQRAQLHEEEAGGDHQRAVAETDAASA